MLSYSTPYSGYSFSYDARNRQTQAFVGAIGTSWLVNGFGQRIGQMNGSVPQFFFVYDEAGHLIGKYDGNGNLLWRRRGSAICQSPRALPRGYLLSRRIIVARRIRLPTPPARWRGSGTLIHSATAHHWAPSPTIFAARATPCIDHDLV